MPRPQKYRDVVRFLRSQGWVELRQKGSHVVWDNPNGPGRIVVAAHGEVSAGVVKQLLDLFPDAPQAWR